MNTGFSNIQKAGKKVPPAPSGVNLTQRGHTPPAFTKVPSDHSYLMVSMRPVTEHKSRIVRDSEVGTNENREVRNVSEARETIRSPSSPSVGTNRKIGTACMNERGKASQSQPAKEKYAWTFGGAPSSPLGVDFRPSTVESNGPRLHTPANVGPSGKLLLTPLAKTRQATPSNEMPIYNTLDNGEDDNYKSDPDEMKERTSPDDDSAHPNMSSSAPLRLSSGNQKPASHPAHLKDRLRLSALYPLSTSSSVSPGRINYKQGKRTQIQMALGVAGDLHNEDLSSSQTESDWGILLAGDEKRKVAQLAPAMQQSVMESAMTTTTTTISTTVAGLEDQEYFRELRDLRLRQAQGGASLYDDNEGPDFTVQSGTPPPKQRRATAASTTPATRERMRSPSARSLSGTARATSRGGGGSRALILSTSSQGAGKVGLSLASSFSSAAAASSAMIEYRHSEKGLAIGETAGSAANFPLFGETKNFLAAELKFMNDSDKAGRLSVYREAFLKVIEGFRGFGPLLDEIRLAYEDRLSELEELSKLALHGDPSIAIEKEKYLRLQDEALQSMEKGRLQKTILRKRIVDAEQAKRDAVADVSTELTVLRETRVELNEKAIQSTAAVRDLEEMLVTYTQTNKELNERINQLYKDHAAENEDFHRHVKGLQEELGKERSDHFETKKKFWEEIAGLKQKAKALEDVHIAPERYNAMVDRAAKLEEIVTALERKTQWLEKDLKKREKYEPPIDWSMTSSSATKLHEKFPEKTTEDLIRLLSNRMDRALASERELTWRWGHLLALTALTPYGGYGATAARGGYSTSVSSLFSSSAVPQFPFLVNAGQSWSPVVPRITTADGKQGAPMSASLEPVGAKGAVAKRASNPGSVQTIKSNPTGQQQRLGGAVSESARDSSSSSPFLSLDAITQINSFMVTVMLRKSSAVSGSRKDAASSGGANRKGEPTKATVDSDSAASPPPNPSYFISLLSERQDVPEAWFVNRKGALTDASSLSPPATQPRMPFSTNFTNQTALGVDGGTFHQQYVSVYEKVPPQVIRENRQRLVESTQQCHPVLNITPATVRQLVAGAFVSLTSLSSERGSGSSSGGLASLSTSLRGGGGAGNSLLVPQQPITFVEACDYVFRRYYERRSFSFYDGAAYPYYPNDWLAEKQRVEEAAHEAEALRLGSKKKPTAEEEAEAKASAERAAKTAALKAAIAALKKKGGPLQALPGGIAGEGGTSIPRANRGHLTSGSNSPRGGGGGNPANAANLGTFLTDVNSSANTATTVNFHNHTAASNAPSSAYAPHHAQTGASRYPVAPTVEDTPSFAHVVATILHVWSQISLTEPFFRTLLLVLTAPSSSSLPSLALPIISESTLRGYSNSFVNILRCSVGRLLRLQNDKSNDGTSGGGGYYNSSSSGSAGGGFGSALPPPPASFIPTSNDGATVSFVPNGLTITDVVHTLSTDVLSKTPDQWAAVRIALSDQLTEQYRQMCALYVSVLAASGVDARAISAAIALSSDAQQSAGNGGFGKERAAQAGATASPTPVSAALPSQPFTVFATSASCVGDSNSNAMSPTTLGVGGTNSTSTATASPLGQLLPHHSSSSPRGQSATQQPATRGGGGNRANDINLSANDTALSTLGESLFNSTVVALPTPDTFAARRHFLQPADIMGYPTIGEASPLLMVLFEQFWGDVMILTQCVSTVIHEYVERGGLGRSSSRRGGRGNLFSDDDNNNNNGNSALPFQHIGEGVTINQAVALVKHSHLLTSAGGTSLGNGAATALLASVSAADEVLESDIERRQWLREVEAGATEGSYKGFSPLEEAFLAAEAEIERRRGSNNVDMSGVIKSHLGLSGARGGDTEEAAQKPSSSSRQEVTGGGEGTRRTSQASDTVVSGSELRASRIVNPPEANESATNNNATCSSSKQTMEGNVITSSLEVGMENKKSETVDLAQSPPQPPRSSALSGTAPQSLRFLQLVLQRFSHFTSRLSKPSSEGAKGDATRGGSGMARRGGKSQGVPTAVDTYEPNTNSYLTVAIPPTECAWTITELLAKQILYTAAGNCPNLQDAIGNTRIGHVFVQHKVTLLPKLICFECDPTPSYCALPAASASPQNAHTFAGAMPARPGTSGQSGAKRNANSAAPAPTINSNSTTNYNNNNTGSSNSLHSNRVNNAYALYAGNPNGAPDEFLSLPLLVPSVTTTNGLGNEGRKGRVAIGDESNDSPRGGTSNQLISSSSSTVLRTFALSALGLQDIYCDATVAVDTFADQLLLPYAACHDNDEADLNLSSPLGSPRGDASDGGNSTYGTPRLAVANGSNTHHHLKTFSVAPSALLRKGANGQSSPPISTLYNGKSTAPSLYHVLHRHLMTATSFLWAQQGTTSGPDAKRYFHARYLSFVSMRDLKASLADYSAFSPSSPAFAESPPFRTLEFCQIGNSKDSVASLQPMMDASLGFSATIPSQTLVRSIVEHCPLVPHYFNVTFERQKVLQMHNAALLAAEREDRKAREREKEKGGESPAVVSASPQTASAKRATAAANTSYSNGIGGGSATANQAALATAAALTSNTANRNNATAKDFAANALPHTGANRTVLRDRTREHELGAKTLILDSADMAPSQQPMILYASC